MFTRVLLGSLLSLWFLGLAENSFAQEKTDSPPSLMMIGAHGGGHCNGAVVFEKKRAVVCFGLKKSPKEKEKYLYIILFKNDPGERIGDGVSGKATGANTWKSDVRITRGGKAIEMVYQYTIDEKTQTFQHEVLKVGGTEIKEGEARVFLVDLAQEKIVYRPVKVDLPDAIPTLRDKVPELSGEEGKAWAATMLRAVEQLKKKSPEVKKFLEP